jgi:hypothetical protein
MYRNLSLIFGILLLTVTNILGNVNKSDFTPQISTESIDKSLIELGIKALPPIEMVDSQSREQYEKYSQKVNQYILDTQAKMEKNTPNILKQRKLLQKQ